METLQQCNLCTGDHPFQAPNDPIGAALMQEHLREAHHQPTKRPDADRA